MREGAEQCDDSNTSNLDGCNASCSFEQIQRVDYLAMQWGTDTVCTKNALGGAIVNAEGAKQAAILAAEGQAEARMRVAQAEAQAIQMVAKAIGGTGNPAQYLIGNSGRFGIAYELGDPRGEHR